MQVDSRSLTVGSMLSAMMPAGEYSWKLSQASLGVFLFLVMHFQMQQQQQLL